MKNYIVTLVLIVGYYDADREEPRLRYDEYEVQAENETMAIEAAKELDKTGFSIWESYASLA